MEPIISMAENEVVFYGKNGFEILSDRAGSISGKLIISWF